VVQVGFAPRGDIFAAIHNGELLLVKNEESVPGQVPRKLAANRFAFSSDGKTIAVSTGSSITLWDLRALLNTE
jgi:hypothetical protein